MDSVDPIDCPETTSLEAYLSGELDPGTESEIQNHLATCESCKQASTDLEALTKNGQENSLAQFASRETIPVPGDRQTDGFLDRSDWTAQFEFSNYELVRVIGRGGMGLVFEARQKSTDQRVALKIIDPEVFRSLNPKKLKEIVSRFESEAKAVGKITSDFVVKVFDAGEENGRHFCAMQLVDGVSLHQKARDNLSHREAAHYLQQAALGIEAAHQQGILHRDVKPQNILVSKSENRALVTDFGIAKLPRYSETQTELTQHDSVMGTPGYMSPEQLADTANVDVAADVYSLGASLYHCLTSQPPFRHENPVQQIDAIRNHDPVPPRTFAPAVPVDLEAICLKCLEKNPGSRYASAGEVADDLGLFLEGKPTQARPITRLAKLKKTALRYPVIASLSATILILTLGIATVVAASWINTNRINKKLSASLNQEVETREQLRKIFNTYFLGIGQQGDDESLLNSAGVLTLRKKLANDAIKFYEYINERLDSVDTNLDLARARGQLATIETYRGNLAEAREWRDELIEQIQPLAEQFPDNADVLFVYGKALNERGENAFKSRDNQQAKADFLAADRVLEELMRLRPEESDNMYARIILNISLSKIFLEEVDYEGAKNVLEVARKTGETIVELDGFDYPRLAICGVFDKLAGIDSDLGEYESAEKYQRRSVELANNYLEATPTPRLRAFKAFYQTNLVGILFRSGKTDLALEEIESALATQEKLAEADPEDLPIKRDVSLSRYHRARLLDRKNRTEEAIDEMLRAVADSRKILELYPDDFLISIRELDCSCFAAGWELAENRLDRAHTRLQWVVDRCKQPKVAPEHPEYLNILTFATTLLTQVLSEKGLTNEARKMLDESNRVADMLIDDDGFVPPLYMANFAAAKYQFIKSQLDSDPASNVAKIELEKLFKHCQKPSQTPMDFETKEILRDAEALKTQFSGL